LKTPRFAFCPRAACLRVQNDEDTHSASLIRTVQKNLTLQIIMRHDIVEKMCVLPPFYACVLRGCPSRLPSRFRNRVSAVF
jgi:hypothetical protein